MTLSEILKEKPFLDLWDAEIKKLHKIFRDRPKPKEGYSYRRCFYERMSEKSQLELEFFVENVNLIILKKSTLSSEIRSIIFETYQIALYKYATTINKELLCT